MRVLTFDLSPVIKLGLRNPRKKERKNKRLFCGVASQTHRWVTDGAMRSTLQFLGLGGLEHMKRIYKLDAKMGQGFPVKLSFSERNLAGKYFFGRQVLAISLIQLFQIFIWLHTFDWIGAQQGCIPYDSDHIWSSLIILFENRVRIHFTCEITLNDGYLNQFLPDCKVLGMTFNFFWDLHQIDHFDGIEAIFIKFVWVQINSRSHLGEETQRFQNLVRGPSDSYLKSIESACCTISTSYITGMSLIIAGESMPKLSFRLIQTFHG